MSSSDNNNVSSVRFPWGWYFVIKKFLEFLGSVPKSFIRFRSVAFIYFCVRILDINDIRVRALLSLFFENPVFPFTQDIYRQ